VRTVGHRYHDILTSRVSQIPVSELTTLTAQLDEGSNAHLSIGGIIETLSGSKRTSRSVHMGGRPGDGITLIDPYTPLLRDLLSAREIKGARRVGGGVRGFDLEKITYFRRAIVNGHAYRSRDAKIADCTHGFAVEYKEAAGHGRTASSLRYGSVRSFCRLVYRDPHAPHDDNATMVHELAYAHLYVSTDRDASVRGGIPFINFDKKLGTRFVVCDSMICPVIYAESIVPIWLGWQYVLPIALAPLTLVDANPGHDERFDVQLMFFRYTDWNVTIQL
jgi:hypothetical protein